MTDLTLDDLASPSTNDDGDDVEATNDGDSGGGEWIDRLMNRLDERGYLDAIIAQQFDVNMNDNAVDPGNDNSSTDTEDGLSAANVAQFGKIVIDNVGDIPMSQVVQYAENNPDVVDQLINRAMGE